MARLRRLEGIQERIDTGGLRHYRGTVYAHGRKLAGPWTPDPETAIRWRKRKLADSDAGLISIEQISLGRAVEVFTAGIADGSILNRSGATFKPSVIRGYTRDLALVASTLGPTRRLEEIRLPDMHLVVEALRRRGLSGSRVRNVLIPTRSMYAWALLRGLAHVNPTIGLRIPLGDEKARERIATREETDRLIAALDFPDRTAFALAATAGLRVEEILALDWSSVHLNTWTIRVERACDIATGEIIDPLTGVPMTPKSKAGIRDVPISDRLTEVLLEHAVRLGSTGLVFPALRGSGPRDPSNPKPMSYSGLTARLGRAWTAAGLEPLGLHEGRHTFASTLIAAGLSPKSVCTYMGHSSITITFDRYGHLFPGHEAEARDLLNTYERAGI